MEQRQLLSTTLYQHGFESSAPDQVASGVTATWNKSTRSTAPNGQKFLGEFGKENISLSVGNLMAHTKVTVSFDLYLARSWDGTSTYGGYGPDYWGFSVDGTSMLNATFSNKFPHYNIAVSQPQNFVSQNSVGGTHNAGTGAAAIGSLGYDFQGRAGMDAVYHFEYTLDHSDPTLTLLFRGAPNQDKADEAWGIDNVKVEAVTVGPPAATPVGVEVSAADTTGIALYWADAAPDSGITGYNVYRSTDSNFVPSTATRVGSNLTASQFADTAVTPDTTYYYRVTAIGSGVAESSPTVAIGVTAGTRLQAAPIVSPEPSINLTWSAAIASGAEYRIHRSSNPSFTPGPSTLLSVITEPYYNDHDVDVWTSHYYRVQVVSGTTVTGTSNVIGGTPVGVTVSGADRAKTLDWPDHPSSGATYNIYRFSGNISASTAEGDFELVASNISGSSYVDANPPLDLSLYYQVAAVIGGTESPRSDLIKTATDAMYLRVVSVTHQQVSLDWAYVGNTHNSFEVRRAELLTGVSLTWQTLATLAPTATSYVDPTAAPSMTYAYAVYPISDAGEEGGRADRITVTTPFDPAVLAPVVTIVATDPEADEEGSDPAVFTITRTGDTTRALLVQLSDLPAGTALHGVDYGRRTAVTIPAGAASTTLTVTPFDDELAEPTETVVYTLDPSPAYQIGSADSATATIRDNDGGSTPTPTIAIAATDDTAAEMPTGDTPNIGMFTLTRTGDLSASLVVNYTVSGTAVTDGSDYIVLSGTVQFAPNSAIATITITPTDDLVEEIEETVIVTFEVPTGYTLDGNTSETVTILDDDSSTTPVDPDIDLDILSDLDEDGIHDDVEALEPFENNQTTYLPLASHFRPLALALRVGDSSTGEEVILTFDSSKVNLYADESRTMPLSSGIAVPLSAFTLDASGFAVLYADANEQGMVNSGIAVKRVGATGASTTFLNGGLGGAPSSYDFSNVKALSPEGYDPMIWTAYLLSNDGPSLSGSFEAEEQQPIQAAAATSNPFGILWSNKSKLIVNEWGDWAYIEVFNNGKIEVVVYSNKKPFGPNTPTPANSQLYKVVKNPGSTVWNPVASHSQQPVALPANAQRAARILEVVHGNITNAGIPIAQRHRGLLNTLEVEFAPNNLARANAGNINTFMRRFAGALAFAGTVGLLVNAAQANPLAADPEPVFTELQKWHNNDTEEIFVKIVLDAYVRELFNGLPDEVLSATSAYIFYVLDLEEIRSEVA